MSKYPNSGILSKNDRKEKDSHPDRKGQAEIDGVEYWVSGWIKQGNKGPFMSLSFQKKEEKTQQRPNRDVDKPKTNTGFDDMDDEIPW